MRMSYILFFDVTWNMYENIYMHNRRSILPIVVTNFLKCAFNWKNVIFVINTFLALYAKYAQQHHKYITQLPINIGNALLLEILFSRIVRDIPSFQIGGIYICQRTIYYIISVNLSVCLSVRNFLKNGWTYGHQKHPKWLKSVYCAYLMTHIKECKTIKN